MNKKLYSKFFRLCLNLIPCIRGGRGKVIALSEDFRHLTVRLRLSLWTRNIVGTIYGGSMYASTDPMFMLMLMEILGKSYVVWDKGCTIRFKRPAKTTLYAQFDVTDEMLREVNAAVDEKGEGTFTWTVAYKDKEGSIYCEFDKVLYVAKKEFYKQKLDSRIKVKSQQSSV